MATGTWVIPAAMAVVALGLTGCGASSPVAADNPTSTTTASGMPPMTHFRIGRAEGPVQNCSVDGVAVTCVLSIIGPSTVESFSGTVTGTLTGLTLTGTSTTHQRFRDEADPACILEIDETEPVDYLFRLDGNVVMHNGRGDVLTTRSGSCSGTESATGWPGEDSAPWAVID